MKKQSFWSTLGADNRYLVGNLFFLYLVHGVFVIGIGSILPMLKAEYGLSYDVGGYLISAHAVGNLVAGMMAGVLPLYIGYKRALLWLNITPYLGFALTLVTGNPALLIFALLLTGIGRGAVNNYNNQIVNDLSGDSSAPLNMLHGFFAIGAVLAPVLVLACTGRSDSGWRIAVGVIIVLGVITMLTSPRMKMEQQADKQDSAGTADRLGFLRRPLFWRTVAIMFFYLCVEASVMGWLVTYFIDSGAASESFAQVLTSVLWVIILLGRFGCAAIAHLVAPARFLLYASGGILLFLALLLSAGSFAMLLLATAGLGLCMAGMYGTTIANGGSVFKEFPLAMGACVALTGIGSIITPSVVGSVAGMTDIHFGMTLLLVPAMLLVIGAVYNLIKFRKKTAQAAE